jgi:hypothetical protein
MQVLTFASADAWSRRASFEEGCCPKLITFPRRRDATEIGGVAVRGERNLYTVVARVGQVLAITVESVENNAGFEVYGPGVQVRGDAAATEVVGEPLNEAEAERRTFCHTVCATGPDLVSVGATRGNATYLLHVALSEEDETRSRAA